MIKQTLKKAGLHLKNAASKYYQKGLGYARKIIPPWSIVRNKNEQYEQPDKRLKDLLRRVDESTKHTDPYLVPEKLQPELQSAARQIATEGFYDGVTRVESGKESAATALITEKLLANCVATLSGENERINGQINSQLKIVNGKRNTLELHLDYQQYLYHHYKYNERGYSMMEFWMYMSCYIVLFIADLPLLSQMLKFLYGIRVGQNVHKLLPIQDNLEVLILAIGMGVSTIFIKYCYDDFVGKKYGHTVISRKKFKELFQQEKKPQDLTDSEIEEIEKKVKEEQRIKKVILLFTVITLILIGVFRGSAWIAGSSKMSVHPWLISVTMIFISLLFSLVGGACLSLSLSALVNSRRLKSNKREVEALERDFTEFSEKLSVLKGEQTYVQRYLDRVGDGSKWLQLMLNFLYSYYKMGFKEGFANPTYFMQRMDFFDQIVQWRKDVTAVRINSDINTK